MIEWMQLNEMVLMSAVPAWLLNMSGGQLLEGTMIACFGAAWPASIWKIWRTKRTEGKSLIFLCLVLAGYLVGLASKFVRVWGTDEPAERIWILYIITATLVSVDLSLVLKYRRKN